jgi:hypothetical protein
MSFVGDEDVREYEVYTGREPMPIGQCGVRNHDSMRYGSDARRGGVYKGHRGAHAPSHEDRREYKGHRGAHAPSHEDRRESRPRSNHVYNREREPSGEREPSHMRGRHTGPHMPYAVGDRMPSRETYRPYGGHREAPPDRQMSIDQKLESVRARMHAIEQADQRQ